MREALALAMLLAAPAALARPPATVADQLVPGMLSIINDTGQEAMQLYARPSGRAEWDVAALSRPIPPGGGLLRRLPPGECRMDLRLVLADGRAAVLRAHDGCTRQEAMLRSVGDDSAEPRRPGLVRVVNATGQPLTALTAAPAGQPGPPPDNRLRRPLPPGESLLVNAARPRVSGAGAAAARRAAGCGLDLRATLADGREEARPAADICATPTVMLGTPAAPAPAAAATPRQRGADGLGSGFVVAPEMVMTNHHVARGCREVVVRAPDGRRLRADLDTRRTDERLDLAVVRVPGLRAPALPLSAAPPRLGEDAVLAGYPLPDLLSADLKLARGEVSGLNGPRGYSHRLQLNMSAQPGNSGGPVLNARGAVLGIIVSIIGYDGMNLSGISFAIKAEEALGFLRAQGITPPPAPAAPGPMSTADIGDVAAASTVQVFCRG